MANSLMNTSYWILNKSFVKEIGVSASLLIAELSYWGDYYRSKKMLDKDGFFFRTREMITKTTSLSSYEQSKAIKILEKYKMIECRVHGAPPKTYYKVYDDTVEEFISLWKKKLNKINEEYYN